MASPACCAAGPPVSSDYQPTGSISKVGDVDTYLAGSGPKSIIIVYDIFGFSKQAKQVCDMLAAGGFSVAMPDFFKGEPWLLENFPPKNPEEFKSWVTTAGSWDDVVRPGIEAVSSYLKEKGAEVFGVLGFCWGGKMSMLAAALGPDVVKAAATVHPAMLTVEYAEAVKVPMLVMPSGDEPDLTPLEEAMRKKDFGDKCVFHRFGDMHHGFCAARGDWTKPQQAARASEAIGMTKRFFTDNL